MLKKRFGEKAIEMHLINIMENITESYIGIKFSHKTNRNSK